MQRHQKLDGHPDQREAAELEETEGARHEDPGEEVAAAHERLVDEGQVRGQIQEAGGAVRPFTADFQSVSSISSACRDVHAASPQVHNAMRYMSSLRRRTEARL